MYAVTLGTGDLRGGGIRSDRLGLEGFDTDFESVSTSESNRVS